MIHNSTSFFVLALVTTVMTEKWKEKRVSVMGNHQKVLRIVTD